MGCKYLKYILSLIHRMLLKKHY